MIDIQSCAYKYNKKYHNPTILLSFCKEIMRESSTQSAGRFPASGKLPAGGGNVSHNGKASRRRWQCFPQREGFPQAVAMFPTTGKLPASGREISRGGKLPCLEYHITTLDSEPTYDSSVSHSEVLHINMSYG